METIKKVYTEKYNTMVKELEELEKYGADFVKPNGGLSIWVKLPKEIDSIELYNECVENNVALVPGKIFFIDDSIYSNYIRLSFGAVSNEEITQGIKIVENYLRKKYNDDNNEYLPFV